MQHHTRFKALSKRGLLAVATLVFLPGIVLAGGKATLVSSADPLQGAGQARAEESNKTTIIWNDVDTLRMDFGDPSHYLIMRDGKTYSINQDDGEIIVMDMAGMSAMIQTMGGTENKENPFGTIDSVQAMKTTETIAGIKGQVYQLTWTEPEGGQKSGEAVLTDNPLVVEMTQAYFNSISAMLGLAEGMHRFLEALPHNEQGMLQMGEQFYVESIEQIDPPASVFELPAKPISLQDLLKGQMAN